MAWCICARSAWYVTSAARFWSTLGEARQPGDPQSGGRPCRRRQGENPARAESDIVTGASGVEVRPKDVPVVRFQSRELDHKESCLKSALFRPRKSENAMRFIWQRSRTLAIAAVAMVAVGAAVAVGRPHAVSEPLLGTEWQCSRTAFLVTICSLSSERTKQRATAVSAGLRAR